MVSRTPAIRPIQLSALKVLNPLHEQGEQQEDDDGQADIEEIVHTHSYADQERHNQTAGERRELRSIRHLCGAGRLPNGPHAGAARERPTFRAIPEYPARSRAVPATARSRAPPRPSAPTAARRAPGR